MQLPEALLEAIDGEISRVPLPLLKKAAEAITLRYREKGSSPALFQDEVARLAYLPATYAAIHRVLLECVRSLPMWQPKTLLDIGAGPGTGSWAAAEIFPSLGKIVCVEKSPSMLSLGKKLACKAPWHCLQKADWIGESLDVLPADIALLSYLIGEISLADTKNLLEKLWNAPVQMVIVVEPGTPAGFERILKVRNWALDQGAELIAPCPHRKECPKKSPDWCHFPARVERTRLHKLLKNASLGYEDEKFSYLVFGKVPLQGVAHRIVDTPNKASGFVRLPLCTQEGTLQEVGISRKDDRWKAARHAEWGDAWT